MRIHVINDKVTTWLNGTEMVDINDDKIGKGKAIYCLADSRWWRNKSKMEKYFSLKN